MVTKEKLSKNIELKCTKLITIEHLSTEEALMDSWDDSGRWIDTNNTLVFLFSWKVMKQWQIGKRLCLCRLHGYIPTA